MTELCHKGILFTLCFCLFVPDSKSEDRSEGFALAAGEAGRGGCGLVGFYWDLGAATAHLKASHMGNSPKQEKKEVEVLKSLKVEKYPR